MALPGSGAAGGATVGYVNELQPGEPQFRDHGVRLFSRTGATVSELHVRPFEACVGERLARGDHPLFQATDPVGATKGVNTDADDCYVHYLSPY